MWWRELQLCRRAPSSNGTARSAGTFGRAGLGAARPGCAKRHGGARGQDREAGAGRIVELLARVGRPRRRAEADHAPGEVLREGRPPARDRDDAPVVHPQRRPRRRAARATPRAGDASCSGIPPYMRARYETWVEGLNGDWLISRSGSSACRSRSGTALDDDGEPDYDAPVCRREDRCRSTRRATCPTGTPRTSAGEPGGFIGDPDVMDTWATSSLTPQIACGWEDDPDLFARTFPMDLRPQAPRSSAPGSSRRSCARTSSSTTLPWRTRRHLRLGARPRPQEDVEVEGQRRHADGAARAVRRRRASATGRRAGVRASTPRSTRAR